jgi:hypothetical protein
MVRGYEARIAELLGFIAKGEAMKPPSPIVLQCNESIEQSLREQCEADARIKGKLWSIATSLEKEKAELVEALEKYGRHLRSCNIHDMTSVQECDCGFSAALKRAKGE